MSIDKELDSYFGSKWAGDYMNKRLAEEINPTGQEYLEQTRKRMQKASIGLIDVSVILKPDHKRLSEKIRDKYQHAVQPVEVPSWDVEFLAMAKVVAKRSKDAQTQVGAVLTDIHHRTISTGYNGPAAGQDDSLVPNLRPEKYTFYNGGHAELNCLLNKTESLHRIGGGTMYITMKPCFDCLQKMINAGVKRIVAIDTATSSKTDEHQLEFDWIISSGSIEYLLMKPNFASFRGIFD